MTADTTVIELRASAGPANPAGAQQPTGSAGSSGSAVPPADAGRGAAGSTGPCVARQPAACPAVAARPAATIDRRAAAGTPGPSGTEQSSRSAVPAGHPRRARPTGPTIAEQPPARRPVNSGPRGPVGAVADQRAPRGRQQRRVDDGQQLLQRAGVGRFRGGIAAGAGAQGRHELVGKDPHLGTELLIGQAMAGKLRRDRRRHLVLGRGHDRCYPGSGGRIGRIKGRIQACQIVCGGLHHAGHHVNKRHVTPPLGRYTRAAARISIDTLGKLDPTADAV